MENLLKYSDNSAKGAIMGTWSFAYDNLNRVAGSTDTQPGKPSANYCWSYDSFGNRTQAGSNQTFATEFSGTPANPCAPASSASLVNTNAACGANNRMAGTTQVPGGVLYDEAGDVTFDGNNYYSYDAEGRVCATQTSPLSGGTVAWGYLYDAEGRRVAKGSITPSPVGQLPSCNLATNGFNLTESYVLGQGGEQLTTLNVDGNWQRTNVYGGGKLMATYDEAGLHFHLTDPQGTRRVQTNSAGVPELDCQSLPFGDGQSCSSPGYVPADDSTPLHFTGKERDAESGLDYFGARYYASNMGRFMSPDWSAKIEPVPYSKLDDTQTLNLYAYARNNPLSNVDVDGHETEQEKQAKIAAAAKAQNGSTSHNINTTNVSNMQIFKSGSDKCNEFVADTVKSADGTRPVVDGTGKIPTAAQFADQNVKITGLSAPEPLANAKPGDIIAQDHGPGKNGNEEGHVGIVVGLPHDGQPGQTASANANVGGKVTINDWGFRSPTASPNNGERNGASSPAPVVRHPLGDPQ